MAAHLLGLVFAASAVLYLLAPQQPELLRSAQDLWIATALLLSVEAAILGIALSLMPWAAAGETMPALFKRCLKWSWWTSSLAVPATAALACSAAVEALYRGQNLWYVLSQGDGPFGVPLFTVTMYVCCWWLMWVLLRGLLDYGGPAEGPGWEPIEAMCEGCGYRLAFLPEDGICPECAKPVTASLPNTEAIGSNCSSRRAPQRRGFIWLTLAVLGAQPFRRNAPRLEMGSARRFAAVTVLLMLIPLHVTLPALVRIYADQGPLSINEWALTVVLAGAVFTSILLEGLGAALLLGFLAGWWQDKKRDPRVAASTALYSSALLWPFVLLSQGFFVGIFMTENAYSSFGFVPRPEFLGMNPTELYLLGAALLAGSLVLWWLSRLRSHLGSVRYTNS